MSTILSLSHAHSVDDVAEAAGVRPEQGLDAATAAQRLEEHGTNELRESGKTTLLDRIVQQFNNFLIIILIVASAVSFFVGEPVDAAAILVIVVLNAVMGVVQEARAERALEALQEMSAPDARVMRGGDIRTIPSRELVPGDVVLLEAGSSVPADMRLVETVNLRIDESPLTGESVPVEKKASVTLEEKTPLGDRANAAYTGTSVAYGRGTGLVVATGMDTEMGKIADMIQSVEDEQTPLQNRLDQLGRWLGVISLSVCGVIFVYGIARDTDPLLIFRTGFAEYIAQYEQNVIDLFMTAVSLAIAAVPEGLPAVVTICLALGMQRMVRRNALIRRLPAVETLGTATVICTDKTGTLTQNQMTVVEGWVADWSFSVSGEGYEPEGEFSVDGEDGEEFDPRDTLQVSALLRGGMLCNDASIRTEGEGDEEAHTIIGDPTEGAFVVAAAKADLERGPENEEWPRLSELPFTSGRKRMTTIHDVADHDAYPELSKAKAVAFVKGAPDIVLDRCTKIMTDDGVVSLSDAQRERVLDANTNMARRALRVLAVAYRAFDEPPADDADDDEVESDLIFVGLAGMIDPARPEAIDAVGVAKRAGIRTIMVTGDYKETAAAIAEEVGILREGGRVLSGTEIDELSDEELAETVKDVDAFARVSPEHKVRILKAVRSLGHVAAMTGDGVNDAPALKQADIGVAMGITGTDVTKETSEMVLTDDNFASIVAAVEEGRVIYSNIRKFVYYLVSCNIGEILIIFLAMIAGLAIPPTPTIILWLNLVTDGAPALALGVESGDPDIMDRPPRPPKEPVVNREMLVGLVVQAVAMTGAVLAAYIWAANRVPGDLSLARTVAFATLVLSELWRAFTSRSDRYSIFQIGPASNRWMLLAVATSLAFLIAIIYIPFLRPIFDTTFLGWDNWLRLLPFTFVAAIAAEITKMFMRRRARSSFSSPDRT